MIEINKDVLKVCADNLKFDLDDKQLDLLASEFNDLLVQMDFLKQIKDIDKLSPMAFPYEEHLTDSCLRDDDLQEVEDVNEVLSNTKNRLGNQVKIPKVLG